MPIRNKDLLNLRCETNYNVLHKLDSGYQITAVPGQPNTLYLRDAYCTKLAVLELFQDKIIGIKDYNSRDFSQKLATIIINFIRNFHYLMTDEVALDLGLSVIKVEGVETAYYGRSELTAYRLGKLIRNQQKTEIILNGWKKSRFVIPKGTYGVHLNLSLCQIKKLVVSKRSNATIDLSDNLHIEDVVIEAGFVGALNLSRSVVTSIKVADNCRCNITMNYSAKCFDLNIGDVYSGVLDIKDSCFHNLKIGYYSYANIKLSENWGQKNIMIGDSFRGNLIIDSVYVKNIVIGNDCKGKIFIKSKDCSEQGIKSIQVADDFSGELDIGDSKTVERIDIGNNASGRVNLVGCESVRALKIDEYFDGYADMTRSGIMYVRAQKGAIGRFVLMDCSNLTLLKLSHGASPSISLDRSPVHIAKDEHHVYYRYHERQVPEEYFTPTYQYWLKNIKKLFYRRSVN